MDGASILLVLAVLGADVGSQRQVEPPPAKTKRHTAFFAGQSGWTSDTSNPPPAAAPTGDRYQSGTGNNSATVTAPPGVVDRSRAAVIESSNALRDGVEAGIQAANRQLYQGNEQVIDTARSAGQEVSNQFQNWAGATAKQAGIAAPGATGTLPSSTNTRQQVSNPFAPSTPAASAAPAATVKSRGGSAPPPWAGLEVATGGSTVAIPTGEQPSATAGRAPVRTESGWTTVHSTLAPPALVAPRLVNTSPVTISANQPIDQSVAAAPVQPRQPPTLQQTATAGANENWPAASQPVQPATIGNRYGATGTSTDAAREHVMATTPPPALASPGVGISVTQLSPAAGIGAWDNLSGWPAEPAPAQPASVAQRDAGVVAGPLMGNSVTQPVVGPITTIGLPPNPANVGLPAPATSQVAETAPTLQTPGGDQVPWMPLLVVSLSLAGSIGANLFLGWSYIDARQKYRTLVQKTANKFRRAVAS